MKEWRVTTRSLDQVPDRMEWPLSEAYGRRGNQELRLGVVWAVVQHSVLIMSSNDTLESGVEGEI